MILSILSNIEHLKYPFRALLFHCAYFYFLWVLFPRLDFVSRIFVLHESCITRFRFKVSVVTSLNVSNVWEIEIINGKVVTVWLGNVFWVCFGCIQHPLLIWKIFFDFNFFRELRTLLSGGCSLSCLFIQLNNLMHLIVTRDTWSVSYPSCRVP